MEDLRVSLVQGDTVWHDPEANRKKYGALIAPLSGETDLILLPETFTSGFSNDAIHRAERPAPDVDAACDLVTMRLRSRDQLAAACEQLLAGRAHFRPRSRSRSFRSSPIVASKNGGRFRSQ